MLRAIHTKNNNFNNNCDAKLFAADVAVSAA